MTTDEHITPRQQKGILLLIAAFILYWLAAEVFLTEKAWRIAEESHDRWQYVAAERMPANCGWALDEVICVRMVR